MAPNALINTLLARQDRTPESFDAVERLCYTGEGGMGVLEFTPANRWKTAGVSVLSVDR